jgi:hypothetical protein
MGSMGPQTDYSGSPYGPASIVVGVSLLHVGFVQMAWAGQSMLLSKKNVVSRVLEFFE